MKDFAAIDFETANEQPSSVCSVGIVIVRNGSIVDSFYSLIHPEPEYYQWFCQQVHGLCPDDTDDAPVFPYVWEKIEPLIEGLPLVAHNSRFDEGCLKAAFRVYQMDYPDYEFQDTLAASRKHFGHRLPNHQLQTVAAACGYDLVNHHHAQAKTISRINFLQKVLRYSRVIDTKALPTDRISLLSKVTFTNLASGVQMCYTIVSHHEMNLEAGKMSCNSPIGRALMGRKAGEIVEVDVPAGLLKIRIDAVECA